MNNHGDRKSQEAAKLTERLLSYYKLLLTEDLPRSYRGSLLDFQRDFQTILRRTSEEGLSFLTKTMPQAAKAIDSALQSGRLHLPMFRKRGCKNSRGLFVRYALPKFLWVLLSRVFNPFTGVVLGDPDVVAVNDLRQVLYLAYKLELPYDEQTNQKVLDKFVDTDAALPEEGAYLCGRITPDLSGKVTEQVLGAGSMLLRDLLADIDPYDISPKHGPGVVATGEDPWRKFDFSVRYNQIERLYPFQEYFTLGHNHVLEGILPKHDITTLDTGVAKVMLVPKDSRGPRLISAEPLNYMFIQQGLFKSIVGLVERHPLTRGRVNFTDQTINRDLALRGSFSGMFDTLDMAEASDRVSLALVNRLFLGTPILEPLLATRTPRTALPDGRLVTFRKFAPMGSACCFPIEALCFWALGAGVLHVAYGIPLAKAARMIYVYGDDIIVPHGYSPGLQRLFPLFGLKFNEGKCCTTGAFRESCGCDAFKGVDVTPVKLKALPPNSRHDASQILAYIAYSNQLWKRGLYSFAEGIKDEIESLVGPIPLKANMPEGDLVPSWHHSNFRDVDKYHLLRIGSKFKRRWNCNLQRFEFLVLTPRARKVTRNSPDWRELHRCLLSGGDETRACIYTLPRRVQLKRGWAALQ